MRACSAATILVLLQPFPASCATCRGTSVVPRVLVLTHRHLHKSPCDRRPFAEISGSISFSPLWFLSRKLCPIFVCQFKGSLQPASRLGGPTPSLEGFRPQGQDRPRAALTTKRLKSGLITRFWTQALASQFGAGLCRDRGVRFHIPTALLRLSHQIPLRSDERRQPEG